MKDTNSMGKLCWHFLMNMASQATLRFIYPLTSQSLFPGSDNEAADVRLWLQTKSPLFKKIHGICCYVESPTRWRPTKRSTDDHIAALQVSNGSFALFCGASTSVLHPIVPQPFHRQSFDMVHNLPHPGIKASTKLAAGRFSWKGLRKCVRSWACGAYTANDRKCYKIRSPPSQFLTYFTPVPALSIWIWSDLLHHRRVPFPTHVCRPLNPMVWSGSPSRRYSWSIWIPPIQSVPKTRGDARAKMTVQRTKRSRLLELHVSLLILNYFPRIQVILCTFLLLPIIYICHFYVLPAT